MKTLLNNQQKKLLNNNINKNGISMVVLIITIVVMLILFALTVPGIVNVSDEAKAVKFLSNVSIVETKVLQQQINFDNEQGYILPGTSLTSSNAVTIDSQTYPSESNTGNWYLLNAVDLTNMEIKDIEDTFVVNYLTGMVVSQNGVKIKGVMYYTFEEVANIIDFQM